VERIERDGEVVVIAEVRAVAAHFIEDHPLGVAIPAPARQVQIVVVEQDPRFGPLARRRARLRFGLNETGERLDLPIHLVVQLSVDLDRCRDASGADDDVSRGVARGDRQLRARLRGGRQQREGGGKYPRSAWRHDLRI
jgi:hypothetical protein